MYTSGDQLYNVARRGTGTVDTGGGGQGRMEFTGGTGKYAGITGDSTFRAMPIGETIQGRGLMKGDWKLP